MALSPSTSAGLSASCSRTDSDRTRRRTRPGSGSHILRGLARRRLPRDEQLKERHDLSTEPASMRAIDSRNVQVLRRHRCERCPPDLEAGGPQADRLQGIRPEIGCG